MNEHADSATGETNTGELTEQAVGFTGLLESLNRRLIAVERTLATLMLAGILVTMGAQVIARYVFGSPFSWSEEVARLAMIWLTFLAAAYVTGQRSHIAVDVWSARVGRTGQYRSDVLVSLVVITTCLLLFCGGMNFVWYVHLVGSPALGIPKSLWYGAVSVGMLLIAVHALLNLLWLWQSGRPYPISSLIEDEGFQLEFPINAEVAGAADISSESAATSEAGSRADQPANAPAHSSDQPGRGDRV